MNRNSRIIGQERVRLAYELKSRYEAGASVRALALEFGRSYGSIHRMLADAGTTFRERSVKRVASTGPQQAN
ncbi:helix-turn-helix domain-containing protein [Streptomyces chryseus]